MCSSWRQFEPASNCRFGIKLDNNYLRQPYHGNPTCGGTMSADKKVFVKFLTGRSFARFLHERPPI